MAVFSIEKDVHEEDVRRTQAGFFILFYFGMERDAYKEDVRRTVFFFRCEDFRRA